MTTATSPPAKQRLLSRFWQSARGFWSGATAPWAWLLTVLLIATVLLQLLTQYSLNFWNRDFFNAVERKDGAELLTQASAIPPLAAASLALAVFSVWGRMTLQRKWREWLSNHLYDYWLERDHYVRLRFMPGEHQAPEYRIAEDARLATDLPVDLVLGLFSSLITGITFIGILWTVGGSLDHRRVRPDADHSRLPRHGGHRLLRSLVAAAMMLIGSRLTHVVEDNKRTEAELRAIGTHIRESGEGKTLPDDTKDGLHAVSAALRAVIAMWLEYCWQLMRLTVVTHSNSRCWRRLSVCCSACRNTSPARCCSARSFRRPQPLSWCRAHATGSPTTILAWRIGPPPPTASHPCCLRWTGSTNPAQPQHDRRRPIGRAGLPH